MLKRSCLIVLIIWFCLSLAAPPLAQIGNRDLANKIEKLYSSHYLPNVVGGYAAAILKDGKVLFKAGYGYANSEHDILFTSSTVFDFASVAKMFTGFAIGSLVQQGSLSLGDDIRKYLPELADFGDIITIEHLLHHKSGIRDWAGLARLSGRYKTDVITELGDMVKRVLNFKERRIGSMDLWRMILEKSELDDGSSVNYGFGVSFSECRGVPSYGHGSGWGGNVCQITNYPSQRFSIIFIPIRL